MKALCTHEAMWTPVQLYCEKHLQVWKDQAKDPVCDASFKAEAEGCGYSVVKFFAQCNNKHKNCRFWIIHLFEMHYLLWLYIIVHSYFMHTIYFVRTVWSNCFRIIILFVLYWNAILLLLLLFLHLLINIILKCHLYLFNICYFYIYLIYLHAAFPWFFHLCITIYLFNLFQQ